MLGKNDSQLQKLGYNHGQQRVISFSHVPEGLIFHGNKKRQIA